MFRLLALGVEPLKPEEVAGRAKRLVLAPAMVIAAILLASGVAIAATLEGTNNADTINGYGGGDTITGRDGPDDLDGGQGRDTIYGGQGEDTLKGGGGGDAISGGSMGDTIYGDDGRDTIDGNDGGDTVYGGSDADDVDGGDGNDTINAEGGRDKIRGGSGDDEIDGGEGDDKVYAKETDLYGGLVGGPGVDTIRGGPGNDNIIAGPSEEDAEDVVSGDDADDTIVTANHPARMDRVSCGDGQDTVIADKQDTVADDCEDVKYIEDEVRKALAAGAKVDQGIAAFERHMKVGRDGQLKLDKEGLNQEDVDPTVHSYLKDQLDKTNKRIRDGKTKAEDVFPRSNVRKSPFTNMSAVDPRPGVGVSSSSSSGGVGVLQTDGGESGVGFGWAGPELFLSSSDATIARDFLAIGGTVTGFAALLATEGIITSPGSLPLGVASFVQLLGAGGLTLANDLCGDTGLVFRPLGGTSVSCQ